MLLRPVFKPSSRVCVARMLGLALAVYGTLLPAAGSRPSIRIELLAEAAVRSSRVTLGDIARITSTDDRSAKELRALPLGDGPVDDTSVSLGRESLIGWIEMHEQDDTGPIEWSGAPACRIHRVTQPIAGERIARSAEDRLLSLFKSLGLKAEVRSLRPPAEVAVPAGAVELRPRTPPAFQADQVMALQAKPGSSALFSRHQSVWVDIWVEGRFVRTVVADFNVSIYAPAYVAKQDIVAGASLDPSQLEVREVEWSGRSAMPLPVKSSGALQPRQAQAKASGPSEAMEAERQPGDGGVKTYRVRHPLAAGQVVSGRDLEPLPTVVRGSTVKLIETQGGIRIELPAVALQDGFLGHMIGVKVSSATKPVQAVVVGPGQVEVGR